MVEALLVIGLLKYSPAPSVSRDRRPLGSNKTHLQVPNYFR